MACNAIGRLSGVDLVTDAARACKLILILEELPLLDTLGCSGQKFRPSLRALLLDFVQNFILDLKEKVLEDDGERLPHLHEILHLRELVVRINLQVRNGAQIQDCCDFVLVEIESGHGILSVNEWDVVPKLPLDGILVTNLNVDWEGDIFLLLKDGVGMKQLVLNVLEVPCKPLAHAQAPLLEDNDVYRSELRHLMWMQVFLLRGNLVIVVLFEEPMIQKLRFQVEMAKRWNLGYFGQQLFLSGRLVQVPGLL